jgi:MOSC domain-containing protein YiiM
MQGKSIGRVLSIALRQQDKRQMTEVTEADAERDGGLVGDLAARPERGVTLIAAGQWREVQKELQAELPWYTRRANVFVEADSLGELIGARIKIGDVVLQIEGETRPCDLMDRLHFGLRGVLKPDARGGVHGRVLESGRIRVGDLITRCGD